MSLVSRRVLRGIAVAAAVLTAYAGGVVTGVVGSHAPQPSARPAGVIDEAAERIASDAARPVSRRELERAAVEGMLKALGDRWSSYYQPSQFTSFQEALEGRYTGVGLWVKEGYAGGVEVASVQPGSPAAAAGLRGGDGLLQVDGQPVAGMSIARVVELLRGRDGSAVSVTVLDGAAPRTVVLERTRLTTDDVLVERLTNGVTRIRVVSFTRGVGRQVRGALAGGATDASAGVVLDLRNNPGGLLTEAVEVASAFLDGGPVVSYERRGEGTHRLDALGEGDTTTPVVVLVDGATASAAEVVAAALQDRNRAVVVGARTYGKGSVQESARLPNGAAIELTVGRYRTPAGRTIEGVGVEPDVAVAGSAVPELAERRAVEVLTGLVAALDPNGRG